MIQFLKLIWFSFIILLKDFRGFVSRLRVLEAAGLLASFDPINKLIDNYAPAFMSPKDRREKL